MRRVFRFPVPTIIGALSLAPLGSADVHPRVLVATGDVAAGFPDGSSIALLANDLNPVQYNDRGQVLFAGWAEGPGVTEENDGGLWLASHDRLHLLLREGDLAPDLPDGTTIALVGAYPGFPRLANSGDVLAAVVLSGPDVTTDNEMALYRCRVGRPPRLVAREGDPAPGLPAGARFGDFARTRAWSAPYAGREFVFYSWTAEADGVFVTTETTPQLLAGTGTTLAGLPAGVHIRFLLSESCVDQVESVAIHARIDGPGITISNNMILAVFDRDGGRIVVRRGSAAPDLPAGFSIEHPVFSHEFVFGDARQAFHSLIQGSSVTGDDDDAWYLVRDEQPHLVARQGQSIPELGPDALLVNIWDWTATGDAVLAQLHFEANPSGPAGLFRIDESGFSPLLLPGQDMPTIGDGFTLAGFGEIRQMANAAGRTGLGVGLYGETPFGSYHTCLIATDRDGEFQRVQGWYDLVPTALGPRAVLRFATAAMNANGGVAWRAWLSGMSEAIFRADLGCSAAGCDAADAVPDCRIDLDDLLLVLSAFGSTDTRSAADLDIDGDVDLADLSSVLAAFGNQCGG